MAERNLTTFWSTQSGHDTDALLADPVLLWSAACEYFSGVSNTPVIAYGRDDTTIKRVQPFTLLGFCLYIDCPESYFKHVKKKLALITDEKLTPEERARERVMGRIEACIEHHKFIYSAAGLLNTRFMALDLGMYERKNGLNCAMAQ